jgi:hypothetical protein
MLQYNKITTMLLTELIHVYNLFGNKISYTIQQYSCHHKCQDQILISSTHIWTVLLWWWSNCHEHRKHMKLDHCTHYANLGGRYSCTSEHLCLRFSQTHNLGHDHVHIYKSLACLGLKWNVWCYIFMSSVLYTSKSLNYTVVLYGFDIPYIPPPNTHTHK